MSKTLGLLGKVFGNVLGDDKSIFDPVATGTRIVDKVFGALGVEYDISDAFTLRGGVGSDESPTNDATRTPRLPDNDRMLYSIGASWNVSENLSIDAAFQRITIDSPAINLGVDAAAGNTSTLVGEFDGHANLYGVSMQYRF